MVKTAAGSENRQARKPLDDIKRDGGNADAPAKAGSDGGDGERLQRHRNGHDGNADPGGNGQQERSQNDSGQVRHKLGCVTLRLQRTQNRVRRGQSDSH